MGQEVEDLTWSMRTVWVTVMARVQSLALGTSTCHGQSQKKKKNPRNLGSAKTLPLLDCNTMCEALGTLLALVLASETDQLNLSLRVCRDKVRPELWSVVVKIFQILCDSSDQKILQLRRRSLQ